MVLWVKEATEVSVARFMVDQRTNYQVPVASTCALLGSRSRGSISLETTPRFGETRAHAVVIRSSRPRSMTPGFALAAAAREALSGASGSMGEAPHHGERGFRCFRRPHSRVLGARRQWHRARLGSTHRCTAATTTSTTTSPYHRRRLQYLAVLSCPLSCGLTRSGRRYRVAAHPGSATSASRAF